MRAVSASTDSKCVRSSMSAAAAMWDSPGCISRTIPEIYRCGVVPQRALPGVLADELEVAGRERARGARAGQVGAEEERGGVGGGDRTQGARDVVVRRAEAGGLHVRALFHEAQ